MAAYDQYKVLLDDAAPRPGLGFATYATALADLISSSTPQFAVGIFGEWGSGKTTLMRTIERLLRQRDDVVTVWFNAWRYEREPHLIVPLLDLLRIELLARAQSVADEKEAGAARKAAAAVARAGKALLAGATLSASFFGLEAKLEPAKVLQSFMDAPETEHHALSFYQAGFRALDDATREFSQHGFRRVVVFVDDLDRCLPDRALEMLESMKLFFDIDGFVFVAGLDHSIVERAVTLKFQAGASGPLSYSDRTPRDYVKDYVKKVFQVPFALPRIRTEQLNDYLGALAENSELSPEQRADFDSNVRRHLTYLPGDDTVNPREVKRLINSYLLQLKMLQSRIEALDPNVLLALQCMSARGDWEELYHHLTADPELFRRAVAEARSSAPPRDNIWLGARKITLPASFIRYIDGAARPLLSEPDLGLYVSATETTRSTDPVLLDAQAILGRIRRTVDDLATGNATLSDAASALVGPSQRLADLAARKPDRESGLTSSVRAFQDTVRTLVDHANDAAAADLDLTGWVATAVTTLNRVDDALRDIRSRTGVGAYL